MHHKLEVKAISNKNKNSPYINLSVNTDNARYNALSIPQKLLVGARTILIRKVLYPHFEHIRPTAVTNPENVTYTLRILMAEHKICPKSTKSNLLFLDFKFLWKS